MATADQAAVRDAEAAALFSGLENLPGLVLAVSGGADSTALLVIAARWAKALKRRRKRAPKLLAVTVDHKLRPEARECRLPRRFPSPLASHAKTDAKRPARSGGASKLAENLRELGTPKSRPECQLHP